MLTPGTDPDAIASHLTSFLPDARVLGRHAPERGPGLLVVGIDSTRLKVDVEALANLEEVLAIEPRGRLRLHNDDAAWIDQAQRQRVEWVAKQGGLERSDLQD